MGQGNHPDRQPGQGSWTPLSFVLVGLGLLVFWFIVIGAGILLASR